MLPLRRAASAESSSTQSRLRSRQSVCLSLSSPRTHRCSLCSRNFHSLQALGGHQNAHRLQRNEMQKMHMQILRNHKQEGTEKPILYPTPVRAISPPAPRNLHHAEPVLMANDQEICLELGLGCGPSTKKLTFYDFMPLKEGHGYGAAPSGSGVKEVYDETPNRYGPYPSHAHGTNAAGGCGFLEAIVSDSVASTSDEPACEYVEVFHRRAYTTEVTSKTELDLTLKL